MAENFAQNSGWSALVDLSACITVAQNMGSQNRSMDPRLAGVFADHIANYRRGERLVRKSAANKNCARARIHGSRPTQINRHCLRRSGQKRELDHSARLRSGDRQRPPRPIQIIDSQRYHLGCTKAIHTHEEQNRVVSLSERSFSINLAQNLPDLRPR